MEIVLVRHGATKMNEERRFVGITDDPLSESGRDLLSGYANDGIYPKIDKLFVSPMTRCRQTAEIVFSGYEHNVVDKFKEMDFGIFEGKCGDELEKDDFFIKWMESEGKLPIPGGELRDDFIDRCANGFEEAFEDFPEDADVVGFVVHGGTIMALLHRFLGTPFYNYIPKNGRGYICKVENTEDGIRFSDLREL